MAAFTHLRVEENKGFVTITLVRPDRRNALDPVLVAELRDAFERHGARSSTRAIVLAAEGPVFCAGADLRWLAQTADAPARSRREDAKRLQEMYQAIDECPCPVIGRVHGPALGGGAGLVAVCDIAIAAETATFAFSEVRVGLLPGIIAPFLLRKLGGSAIRRFCLTGESFSSATAKAIQFVHEVVPGEALDATIGELLGRLREAAPGAVRNTKALLRELERAGDQERIRLGLRANLDMRTSAEAREGLQAFLEKRPPSWAL